ncbi:exopolygalacturonase-like [Pyrus ussuriensis x Pyrus communis]|uniref:Exopolygalacturonase-like n=1 Tax=Pyrus ussuriensis x Pyrus communis TaxID=2448454 RepID=A0A5N5F8H3_9ROSA|nr:exopolygalacturonase-like [Pyrus ussuriensis x Pyrus communis]
MAIAGGMSCHAILILYLAALASRAAASVAIPPAVFDVFRGTNLGVHDKADPDEKIFNVVDFGAKPDGNHDASMHVRITLTGDPRVLIPPGTYKSGPAAFQGPCTSAKPIVVQVLGTIKGLNDLSLYEEPYWFLFEKVEGLVITGNGVFDGQGSSAWKVAGDCGSSRDGCSPLPSSIKFNSVSNGVIRGISSLNSKGVHLFITDSQNVRVRRVNISAPGTSPNTDGIRISNSNNVKVARTHIATGDDCIGMIQGSTNIAINNVICGPGHGIRRQHFLTQTMGLESSHGQDRVPSLASGMVFKDLIMQNVRNPIIIDQEYCAGGCNKNQPSRLQISNVHYINIKGTTPSNVAVDFICSSQVPCQNIQLHDIDLKYIGPNAAALTSVCKNVKAGFCGIQNPPACH